MSDGAATSPDAARGRIRLPDCEAVFRARAARLRALSAGSPAGPFLDLLARIARGQDAAVRRVKVPAGAQTLEGAPLDHRRWKPDQDAWREMLTDVLASAEDGPLPAPAAAAIARLRSARADELDDLASGSLALEPPDLAAAPFVAGALQAYYARLAGALDPSIAAAGGGTCPICAADPVAGTIDGVDRLRHLCCTLCGSSWHVTRVQCARCEGAAALSYYAVADAYSGVQAEACDDCGVYVKLFDLEVRPGAEPVADDAATLVLDLLMAERGYGRAGPNLVAPGGLADERRS